MPHRERNESPTQKIKRDVPSIHRETLAKMEGYAEWETITRKGKTGYEKGVRMEKMLIN